MLKLLLPSATIISPCSGCVAILKCFMEIKTAPRILLVCGCVMDFSFWALRSWKTLFTPWVSTIEFKSTLWFQPLILEGWVIIQLGVFCPLEARLVFSLSFLISIWVKSLWQSTSLSSNPDVSGKYKELHVLTLAFSWAHTGWPCFVQLAHVFYIDGFLATLQC